MPLILLTAIGKRGDARAAKEIGFAAFLSKPVRQVHLFHCLATVMGMNPPDEHANQNEQDSQLITRYTIDEAIKHRFRILVVDDNAVNQTVLHGMLTKLGFQAECVFTGNDAIRSLQELDYDLVFMDCQMPGMDGYETTRRIRDNSSTVKNHDIPVIAITAHAMKGDRKKCLNAGMNDYLTKPIDYNQLVELMKKWTNIKVNQATAIDDHTPQQLRQGNNNHNVFNTTDLLQNLADDMELARQLIETFLDDLPKQIDMLQQALENSDIQNATRLAHGIKGAAANVNSRDLQAIAGEMEQRGKVGRIDQLAQLMPELSKRFDTLSIVMQQFLNSES